MQTCAGTASESYYVKLGFFNAVCFAMPLSPPKFPRRKVHLRRIDLDGYCREDGSLEIEASLCDTKTVDYGLASGVRSAGEPIHEMKVRVTLDREFTITAAEVSSDRVPYPGGCDTIGPAYGRLVGLNLLRGFRRAVAEMFADTRGCTHVTELLLSLPTAAIQTEATFRRDNEDSGAKPFQLDRCHALDTSADTVRRYYPRWYRGPSGAG